MYNVYIYIYTHTYTRNIYIYIYIYTDIYIYTYNFLQGLASSEAQATPPRRFDPKDVSAEHCDAGVRETSTPFLREPSPYNPVARVALHTPIVVFVCQPIFRGTSSPEGFLFSSQTPVRVCVRAVNARHSNQSTLSINGACMYAGRQAGRQAGR